MAVNVRAKGVDVSVFTIDGENYLCDLTQATFAVTNNTANVAGVCDEWAFEWSTDRSWEVSGTVFVSDADNLMAVAAGDAQMQLVINFGTYTLTGNAILTSATHSIERTAYQTIAVSFKGQGAPAFS